MVYESCWFVFSFDSFFGFVLTMWDTIAQGNKRAMQRLTELKQLGGQFFVSHSLLEFPSNVDVVADSSTWTTEEISLGSSNASTSRNGMYHLLNPS